MKNYVVSILICCTLLIGCSTAAVFTNGQTTFDQMKQTLGQPVDGPLQVDNGAYRVRWVRSADRMAGMPIVSPLTYYDGEFGSDNVLRRWRAVDQIVTLNDPIGFDLPPETWAHGFLDPNLRGAAAELKAAIFADDVGKVEALLKSEPGLVSARDYSGNTPLVFATGAAGHLDVAQVLISYKADVNAKDKLGGTVLKNVALAGRVDAAKLLLANGAEVDGVDQYAETPLEIAAFGGKTDMVKFLLASGAQLNHRDKNGRTPLWWAMNGKRSALPGGNHDEVIEFLRVQGGTE